MKKVLFLLILLTTLPLVNLSAQGVIESPIERRARLQREEEAKKKKRQQEAERKRRREAEQRREQQAREAENERTRPLRELEQNMVRVEGGTFIMGGKEDLEGKYPHQVTLSTFAICKYEVTQELWKAVMGSNPPGYLNGKNIPVHKITWEECQQFIRKLNVLTGKYYRLPTEAEWEFAARGGNNSRNYKYAGSNFVDNVAWTIDNSPNTIHPVGQKQPNELGLYDMSGNVHEMCLDFYSFFYDNTSQTNPTGPAKNDDRMGGVCRILRGGSYSTSVDCCAVKTRLWIGVSINNKSGFRLASDIY